MKNKQIEEILSELTVNSPKINDIIKKIQKYGNYSFLGLTNTLKAVFVSVILQRLNVPVLLITPDVNKALTFHSNINVLSSQNTEYFSQQETSPYELLFSDVKILKDELCALRDFEKGKINILVMSAKSLLNLYPSKSFYEKHSFKLKKGQNIDPVELSAKLSEIGYKNVTMVTDQGEFSRRGDILDFYPLSKLPVRLEFWGDEIESVRNFDPESQKTVKHIEYAVIEPRYKTVIKNEDKEILCRKVEKLYKAQLEKIEEPAKETLNTTMESIIASLETETYFEGVEYYSQLLNPEYSDILDFLPKNTLIVFDESNEILSKLELFHKKHSDDYKLKTTEGLLLEMPDLLHFTPDEFFKKLKNHKVLNLDSFISDDDSIIETIDSAPIKSFLSDSTGIYEYISNLRQNYYKVFVFTEYPLRVKEILDEFETPCFDASGMNISEIRKSLIHNDVLIFKDVLSDGFICDELKIAFISDTELFNRKLKKPTMAKKQYNREKQDFIDSIKDLMVGDYVVHLSHGIGKYIGLTKQSIDGQEKDYLTVEYANGDKLHIPAEQINMLSRYRGSGSIAPKLSRMGGADWENIKKKVKKHITDIAQDLLNLYAKRAKTEGFAFEQDTPWQVEMEDAFPFTETTDQMKAIIESKEDMESKKPMDRLICGDVGFGKTEVAIRSIFKALLTGKQAAMLAPTTILAQQHYSAIKERFAPYPVKVELLSRFRSQKQQKETIKNLITGECDLVIGTHRLLQKDVDFKNLGLLIIDEEHRFGVANKEKLKHMRSEIDVLALSATPIPRTLYMALSGVRDMSVINTPPVNRAPVKTYIGEYNESYVKTAVNHEIEREGQVFFLYNRVQSIYKFAKDLENLVPHARIAVAHGQMKESDLEKVMYEFSNHEYDVLVCTTIIESGLDIPNANTIIIYDTDKFGLAQLYQIRGRVGRSERQAYAYCFYKKDKELTSEARKRLQAIKDFTTLGSGYQIAMRDLEIRGVGNLLGSQQHGHMVSVGFDTYCSLLEESINELQGQQTVKKEYPVIDINITAFIPDEWVGSKEQKMIEYKRLADAESIKELELIESEWTDRFGKIPETVKPLIKIIKLRLLSSKIDIISVKETPDFIKINAGFDLNEWNILRKKIPADILRKIKWTKPPISLLECKSVLLLNNSGILNKEILDILEDLFYYISEIKN